MSVDGMRFPKKKFSVQCVLLALLCGACNENMLMT